MTDKKNPNTCKKDRPRHNCLEEGHPEARCPQKFCTACRQFGHAASVCEIGFQCYYCGAKDHMKRQCPRLSTGARDRLQKLHKKRQQDSADVKRSSGTSSRMPAASKGAPVGDSRRPAMGRGTLNQGTRIPATTTVTGVRKGLSFSAVVGVGQEKGVGMQDSTVNEPSPLEKLRAAVAGLPNLGGIAKTQYFDDRLKELDQQEAELRREFEERLARLSQERERVEAEKREFQRCLQPLTALMEARVSLGTTLSEPTSVPRDPFQAVHTASEEAASSEIARPEIIKLNEPIQVSEKETTAGSSLDGGHETRSLEEQMDAEDELLGIDPAAEPQSDSPPVSINTSAASGSSVDDSQPSDPSPENIEPAEETGDLPVDKLQSSSMFGSRDYRYQPGSQQCPGSSPAKNSEPPGLQE